VQEDGQITFVPHKRRRASSVPARPANLPPPGSAATVGFNHYISSGIASHPSLYPDKRNVAPNNGLSTPTFINFPCNPINTSMNTSMNTSNSSCNSTGSPLLSPINGPAGAFNSPFVSLDVLSGIDAALAQIAASGGGRSVPSSPFGNVPVYPFAQTAAMGGMYSSAVPTYADASLPSPRSVSSSASTSPRGVPPSVTSSHVSPRRMSIPLQPSYPISSFVSGQQQSAFGPTSSMTYPVPIPLGGAQVTFQKSSSFSTPPSSPANITSSASSSFSSIGSGCSPPQSPYVPQFFYTENVAVPAFHSSLR